MEILGMKRIGSPNDGGYVVPCVAIFEADALLSLGISDDWSFDKEFKEINPATVIHAYDHTISSGIFFIRFLKSLLKSLLALSTFANAKHALETFLAYPKFFNGTIAHHFRESIGLKYVNSADLKKAISRFGREKLFIKCDIEGSEYEIIEDLLEFQSRIVCLTIEFHHLGTRREEFISAIIKLQSFLTIVHVHGNNWGSLTSDGFPDVIELTMIRSDIFLRHQAPPSKSTSMFDAPNNPLARDYRLNWTIRP
jgi:hypothetical protein